MIRNVAMMAMGLVVAGMVQAETAQEAWTGLVGKRMATRPAFAFVEVKKEHPKASLVWCNTTAVPEGSGGRVPGDSAKYNKVAMRVMKDHPEIVVNDLFAFSKPFMVQGNVHFKPVGCQAQGREVAKVISGVLEKRKK